MVKKYVAIHIQRISLMAILWTRLNIIAHDDGARENYRIQVYLSFIQHISP